MSTMVLALPGGEHLALRLRSVLQGPAGMLDVHRFPDGEIRVRVDGAPDGHDVLLVGSLDRPDAKVLPLLFGAGAVRAMGARRVGLVAPYLPFLRQDAAFRPGEAVSARHFADLLSSAIDWLVTVDPHLHRIRDLRELFTIQAAAVHAAPLMAEWIRRRVERPLIIGPDQESAQWVAGVAESIGAPWTVMAKRRLGDRAVELTLPRLQGIEGREPVLVDDIVASGGTVRAAARLLASTPRPLRWALAVHAVIDPLSAEALAREAGVVLVSCNTIAHPTNRIDVSELLRREVERQMASGAPAMPAPAGR